jgi:energy-coupling factor transporter ATP-binding protein EcfA2/AraC-like DNA-binding protein
MFCEHLRFEQPLTAIRFDAELLRAPIVQNAETLQAFLATAPQSVFLRYKNDDSWTARLRRRLRQASIQAGETHWPLLEELAAELGTNPTTLRRRLEAEGTSYQQLKDRLRSDLAIDRLVSSQASIDELALELGFHDASAFHRAFRRWTGLPPGPTAGASRASRSGKRGDRPRADRGRSPLGHPAGGRWPPRHRGAAGHLLPGRARRRADPGRPSGSGKSTLLRCFNRLAEPGRGTIRLGGEDIRQLDPRQLRRRAAMVMQTPVLFEGTVRDNLCLRPPGHTLDLGEPRLAAVLQEVGLDPALLDRDAAQLSGGEKQRVTIARALLGDPQVLLLDEPTSALDPPNTARVVEVLTRLCRARGMTVVAVSHQPEFVRALGGWVLYLVKGRVKAYAPVSVLDASDAQADSGLRAFLAGVVEPTEGSPA